MHSWQAINKVSEIGRQRNRRTSRVKIFMAATRNDPAAELWRFSLALYGRPGVANHLIGLQDRLGLDVNLVLYCLWLACSGRATEAADIREAVRLTRPWQARTVGILRRLRRDLKSRLATVHDKPMLTAAQELRESVKRLEIEAERIEQMILGRAVQTPRRPVSNAAAAAAARANLRAYLSSRGVQARAPDRTALGAIIDTALSIKNHTGSDT
jgi:uncharacterized protein (TIGR02444 family)